MLRFIAILYVIMQFSNHCDGQILIYSEDEFLNLNPITGVATFVCPISDNIGFGDIALSPDGRLFGISAELFDTVTTLYEIDKITGKTKIIYQLPFQDGVGLVVSKTGIVYIAGRYLRSFDLNTLSYSVLCELPISNACAGDLIFWNDRLFMTTISRSIVEIDLNNLWISPLLTFDNLHVGIGQFNNCITGKVEYYLFGGDVIKVDIEQKSYKKVEDWFYGTPGATSYDEFLPLPTRVLDTILLSLPDCSQTNGKIEVKTTPGTATPTLVFSLDNKNWQSDPVFNNMAPGAYTVYIKNDCGSAEVPIFLTTKQVPPPVDIAVQPAICTSNTGAFTILYSVGLDTLQFSINGGLWQQNTRFDSIPTGKYFLQIMDNNGCINIQEVSIPEKNIAPQWELSITDQTHEICIGEPFKLEITAPEQYNIQWRIGPELLKDSISNVLNWIPTKAGAIDFLATVTNAWGCSSIGEPFYRTVVDCTSIPNAFTPNADGINDTFGLLYYDPNSTYDMVIYNRWGQVVFRSSSQQLTWDGNSPEGKAAPLDVYFYTIRASLQGKETLKASGEVTLLR
jgi:gliding motility-associated-like protein